MQCPRCHARNPDGARFCEDCGARLDLACPSCGQPVGIRKKFCRSCGTVLAVLATSVNSPQSYTPQHLVEKILGSRGALDGERKLVTVLFADPKGSMELLADRDPEEARKLLDPVLERMSTWPLRQPCAARWACAAGWRGWSRCRPSGSLPEPAERLRLRRRITRGDPVAP
jgi:hypothetical protein